MWWSKINPSLAGVTAGIGGSSDPDVDEEQTPEMVMWDMFDVNDRFIDSFHVKDVDFGPPIPDLCRNQEFRKVWYGNDIILWKQRERQYVSGKGDPVFVFRPRNAISRPDEGNCPKCRSKGEFVRTALICPSCNDVIGGF